MSLHSSILLGCFIAALLTGGAQAQLDDDGCLLLTGSRACRGFAQYYVGITDLAPTYPFISNVTDVSSFDLSLYNYINSTSIAQQIGCTNDTQYTRYSLTHLCANLIHESSGSLPCNFKFDLNPPPMCRSTCDDWISGISTVPASDNATCISGLSALRSECDWPGFNGSVGSCVLGSDNEPDNCGW
ncbi:hypothetical protein BX666DRAFT_1860361 [Dichotomocladium elegans]|nr:hypothetical protein BX666DRAFT_1860361 [Dichotomocladium elegans]